MQEIKNRGDILRQNHHNGDEIAIIPMDCWHGKNNRKSKNANNDECDRKNNGGRKIMRLFLLIAIFLSFSMAGCENQHLSGDMAPSKGEKDKKKSDLSSSNIGEKAEEKSKAPARNRLVPYDWLICALESYPESMNPYSAYLLSDLELVNRIFEGLLKYDEQGNLLPNLAENYYWDGENSLIFQVKKGVKWHDDTVFDAFSAADSLGEIHSGNFYWSELFVGAEGFSALDSERLLVKTNGRSSRLLHSFVQPLKKKGAKGENGDFIGTGPFITVNQQDQDTITLKTNENWHGGRPTLKGVIYKIIPDQYTRLLLLKAGQLDMATLYPLMAKRAQDSDELPQHSIVSLCQPACLFVGFNMKEGAILANRPDIRQALALGVDKQGLIDEIFYGFGLPVASPLFFSNKKAMADFSGQTGIKKEDGKGQNDENSQNAVKSLTLIATARDPDIEKTAYYLVENWKKSGIDCKALLLDPKTFAQRLESGDFDLFLGIYTTPFSDDHQRIWSKNGPENLMSFHYSGLDELLENIDKTPEGAEKEEYLRQFEGILKDENPAIFLLYPVLPTALNQRFVHEKAGIFDFVTPLQFWTSDRKRQIY